MVHLPKQVGYALLALAEMHRGKPGQLFSVRTLSTRLNVPYDVVSKGLQGMTRAGILRSIKGRYGGYQIARSVEEISLGELIRAIMGARPIANCLLPGQICPRHRQCAIRRGVVKIETRTREFLESIALGELMGPNRPKHI